MFIYKKGIGLVSVIITVVIMLIILATVVIGANGIVDNTRKKAFARELRLVQSSLDTYIARNSGRIDFDNTVDITVANLPEESVDQFSNETQVDGKITMTIIDLDKIDVEDVAFGNLKDGATDRYLVSSTGKIYYEKGFVVKGKTYYTLTSDLEK